MPSKPMFTNDLFTLSAPASAVAPSLPILLSAKRAMFSSLAHRSDAGRRHEPLKSSFVNVVLLLSATASAWAPSSPRRFTVQGPRSVLRRGRRTAQPSAALAAQVDTRQRRVAQQRLRQRSDADQANVVACTGNSIATNEHARAAPRRTDQRDARHRLVALQPVGQRHMAVVAKLNCCNQQT